MYLLPIIYASFLDGSLSPLLSVSFSTEITVLYVLRANPVPLLFSSEFVATDQKKITP